MEFPHKNADETKKRINKINLQNKSLSILFAYEQYLWIDLINILEINPVMYE